MFVHITGTGSYLPERVVTNDELSQQLDTTDEWIFSHTGIHSRHIGAPEENTSDMAIKAAQNALENAGVAAEDLGNVIVATSSGDYQAFPSVACLVQDAIGAKHAGTFDLQAACAGFVTALQVARGLLQLDPRPILVIGAEMMSRIVDWKDRNTCILFGDGAGAAVLQTSDQPGGLMETTLRGDGSGSHLISRTGGTRRVEPTPEEEAAGVLPVLRMKGRAVYNFAVKIFDEVLNDLLKRSKHVFSDLAWVIPHQANSRIVESVARRMNVPLSKFFMNMETTGNTSAASIPIALDELNRSGKLKPGDLLATVAFGAGLTYGGMLFKWTGALGQV